MTVLVSIAGSILAVDRIVFPQAAVGPIADQDFVIELRLANRDLNDAVECTIRLLAQKNNKTSNVTMSC